MPANSTVRAFTLGGGIAATEIDVQGRRLGDVVPKQGYLWVHLNLAETDVTGEAWLQNSGVDAHVMEALTAPETRPRCTLHHDGVLMNLRGVNLNPGSEPEDMVSLRMWVTGTAVVTLQRRSLFALRDVMEAIERGQAPETPGELVSRIALRLADRTEPVVAELNERIDTLEEEVLDQRGGALRGSLADIRRMSIVMRRYMFPQRDALSTFAIEDLGWMGEHDRVRLREATERVTRLAEELDAIRDRAQVVHDQVMDMRAELMNRQMLVLSVVAAVFLPLGLLTGLLGINVGGIPGADTPWAFWAVSGGLLVIGALQVWLFWRMGLVGRR